MHHSSYEQINPDFLIGKLRYEIASLKDSDRIRIFLDEYFCTREPLQVALEVTPEEIHEQYDSVLPSVLSKPVSILGFEKNELVCICLNSIQELSSENRHDPICDSFNVLKDDYSQVEEFVQS
uniref:N-acetyltransferase domain-containing protein n=1 Tax=Acrobeloides nanus TaxID=290746 RepID=A0A914D961_9BILA